MTIFILALLCGTAKRFHLFEAPKRSVKIKCLCRFSKLFRIGMTRVKTVFVELLTYVISLGSSSILFSTGLGEL